MNVQLSISFLTLALFFHLFLFINLILHFFLFHKIIL